MTDYMKMLKEFYSKYDHFISYTPQRHDTMPVDIMDLMIKLIREELEEFEAAETREDIADSLADLLYVVFGTCLSYGVPIDEVFAEIHRSNMTKSMEKDTKSIKGKTIKGSNYDPPNLKRILERQ